jgi:WD40 repeat protein
VHSHFQTWSPDGRFIYFVHGVLPDELDLWRIRPEGGEAERLTFHQSLVRSPTFLDNRVVLYSARAADGSGPWLYGMDVMRRVPHRVSFGVEQYTSIDASADGRRLVTTVATSKASLWRIPMSDRVIEEAGASRLEVASVHARSPRLGPNYLLYLSSKGDADGLWKLQDGAATELWSGLNGEVSAAPAVSPDGRRIAFPVRRGGRTRLYVMGADATGIQALAEGLDVNGAPAWSPDGKWIAVAAGQGTNARVFKVPVDGTAPIQVATEYSIDPIWSPDGTFLIYAGPNVASTFPVKTVTADGKPRSLPTLLLPRGTRFRFVPGENALLVLKGWLWHKNFFIVDLETGRERQVTNLQPELMIQDFDVSSDGREITFDRLKETSDIVLIDLPKP